MEVEVTLHTMELGTRRNYNDLIANYMMGQIAVGNAILSIHFSPMQNAMQPQSILIAPNKISQARKGIKPTPKIS
jgi:hypothetical protein